MPLFLIFIVALSQTAFAKERSSAQTIVILGDSLSAGYGLLEKESWPHLLQQSFALDNKPYKIINASVSGETTRGGLLRLQGIISTHKPDWVLIELGGNDGLRGFNPSIPRKNLRNILLMLRKEKVKAALVQIRLPRNYGNRYLRLFEDIYPALAKEFSVPLIPFFMDGVAQNADLMQQDGIHPNKKAQPVIQKFMKKEIEKLFAM
ncbi:arylesterase [Algicola sagamiensis]|uniref:arylesterase n=1 Tax=Algicola sagamiensis TaxID=163869 RepID=UPI0003A4A819|nr:arylesterase [Algicola sagamiensis]